ncbi:MAG: hypothetical protein M1114_00650 [Candidatus Dependentiae bacterium]|nr:hypothetical protein [Candidatus Dependentiae bacterium]
MRINFYYNCMLVCAGALLINWGEQSSVQGSGKNKVNFYGTLLTRENKKVELENISIGHMYERIVMYEVPSEKKIYEKKESKYEHDSISRHVIKYEVEQDPRRGIITRIDLCKVAEIKVPKPDERWVFARRKGYHSVPFIEIEITSNDSQKTKHNYLIEDCRKISGDEKNEAGPIEKDIPFNAIQQLTIAGYSYRDMEKK